MRTGFQTLTVAALAAVSALACAQTFPSRPVTLVIPFPPGVSDTYARVIGGAMEPVLGQKVVVEPRPGGGSVIGAMHVINQPPDGHTVLMTPSALAVKSAVPKPTLDLRKDLAPIGQWSNSALFLAVNTRHPFKTAKELIDHAKANPGKLNMGSYGVGSVGHLGGELLLYKAGATAVHVPYQGTAASARALAQGDSDFEFNVIANLAPHVQSGRVRILAASITTRDPSSPEIPSMAESGVPDFDVGAWSGYMVPAGTPRDAILKLNAAFTAARNDKTVIEHFNKIRISMSPKFSSPEEFGATITKAVDDFQKLIRDKKLELE